MLTTPPTFGTSRDVLDLNSSEPEKINHRRNGRKLNSMAENSILCPNGRNLIVGLHGPISNPQLHGQTSTSQHHGRISTSHHHHGQTLIEIFFKIFQILSPSLLGMISSTLQPHFLSGVYYDNGECHILCV